MVYFLGKKTFPSNLRFAVQKWKANQDPDVEFWRKSTVRASRRMRYMEKVVEIL